MGGGIGRSLPVLLIVGFIFLFGCTFPWETGETMPTDPYGAQLEAMNSRIYSADTVSGLNSLYAEVESLEDNISASGQYTDYLLLTQAQLMTIEVRNASLLFDQESGLIASGGVDCTRDYSSLKSILAGMNSTKNTAMSKANSYLAKNSSSKAALLVKALNESDTDGMYLFTVLLDEHMDYYCLDSMTPSKTYTLPLNESEAVQLVVDELVGTTGYYVYSVGAELDSGTVVSVKVPGENTTDRTLTSKTWFFMLDETPLAAFSHDVRFVYVDSATGGYAVTDEVLNPIIDGVEYWADLEDRMNEEWIAYPENPVFEYNESNASLSDIRRYTGGKLYTFPLAIANVPAGTSCDNVDCCKGVGKDKGLIVNGNDQELFHTDTANMYDFMKNDMGMAAGDITYLTAKSGVPESDGVTTLKSFKKAIDDLAKDTECCDRVFIYITGHGINVRMYKFKNKATGEERLFSRALALSLNRTQWQYTRQVYDLHNIDINPKKVKAKPGGGTVTEGHEDGGEMWAHEIGSMLNKIKSCYVTVMYDSCYSGYAAPWLAGRGRTIMTTSDRGSSYAYPKNKKTGKSAGGIWNTLWIMAHTTFKDSADTNNDGTVDHQEAYDYANKYAPEVVKAHTKKEQKGTVTPPKPPCVCCDIVCNESTKYLCTAVEGNGSIDAFCKGNKIGAYCGPTDTGIDDNMTDNVTGNDTVGNGTTTGGGTGGEGGITTGGGETGVTSVCGDGNITGSEQCDYGSASTNKCTPSASGTERYCTAKCECKDIEHTPRCGDGKITTGEDCDGGNVLTNICSEGYKCYTPECRCKPLTGSGQCGDGTVTPPEECDHGNSYTAQCPSGRTCYSCQCLLPGDVPEEQVHYECVNNACVSVPGAGTDECSSSSDCEEEAVCGDGLRESSEECEYDSNCASGYHCSNCHCVQDEQTGPVCGDGDVEGTEECEDNEDCSSGEYCSRCQCVDMPAYCGDGTVDSGEECDPDASPDGCDTPGVCGANCQCVYPPSLNCESICSATPGAIPISGSFSNADACKAGAAAYFGEGATCYTTCTYSWYYKVSNIAGSSSCCCAVKKTFACSDCPGTSPSCPDPNVICPANAPSWVPPS